MALKRASLTVVLATTASVLLSPPPVPAQEMPKSVTEAKRMESDDALPQTAFFSTPKVLSTTRPGDLLSKQGFNGYALPKGATAVRILYHSLDADGRDVATSGVVLLPAGAAPAGGWPIIAWAHGTTGVARECAPSLMKDMGYGEEGLMPMVRAGFAIIATDYHGLGTAGPHQYVNKIAQARDVIFSIPAARAAVPALGRRWVVDGHSQGGLAALGVAEIESGLADTDFLGAISVAGATGLRDLLTHLEETQGVGFYLAFMGYGIHARSPEFEPADMLTPDAMQRYADATAHGCWAHGYAVYLGLATAAMLKPAWTANAWVQRFFNENDTGEISVRHPLLVIAGEADVTVPISSVRATVERACRNGSTVTFRSYPGLDHDPTMTESTPDQLSWIRERFAAQPFSGNCANN